MERCLQAVRSARSDLLESKRVADLLLIDTETMLQIETELAGRVYRNGAGRLFIADLRSPNAFLDMEVQRMRIVLSRAIVKHLPPRQRLVIVGRFLEGRPVEDVAAELGVGVKEIERLQSRAIERLRRVHELQVLAGVE